MFTVGQNVIEIVDTYKYLRVIVHEQNGFQLYRGWLILRSL